MSSPTYSLRLATPSDDAALAAIASRTFVDTFGHLYSPQDLHNYLVDAYDVGKIRSEIEDPNKYTVLLFSQDDSESPCGYAMLHDGNVRTGDSGPSEDYLEIKRLYIDKPHHGKGAAYVLMDHLMQVIREKNRKITWLGVWENNLRGQKFYQKYGFEETGEHVFMVGETKDRDLVFTLKKSSAL